MTEICEDTENRRKEDKEAKKLEREALRAQMLQDHFSRAERARRRNDYIAEMRRKQDIEERLVAPADVMIDQSSYTAKKRRQALDDAYAEPAPESSKIPEPLRDDDNGYVDVNPEEVAIQVLDQEPATQQPEPSSNTPRPRWMYWKEAEQQPQSNYPVIGPNVFPAIPAASGGKGRSRRRQTKA